MEYFQLHLHFCPQHISIEGWVREATCFIMWFYGHFVLPNYVSHASRALSMTEDAAYHLLFDIHVVVARYSVFVAWLDVSAVCVGDQLHASVAGFALFVDF